MDRGDCKMEFGRDAFGKEVLLKDGKFQVMMEWEKPYMEACIDALQPFGDVLEVGFGCGYSATQIQKYAPKSHTIIEYHPAVAQKACEWAKQFPNVRIVEDAWQNALEKLGVFDTIFFDDYPLESEKQMQDLQKGQQESFTLLEKGKQTLEDVNKILPFLKDLVYTNSDLDELIASFRETGAKTEYLSRFLNELRSRDQITAAQEDYVVKRLAEMGIELKASNLKPGAEPKRFQFRGPTERLLTFLQIVLNQHMRKGSRFSCFLSSPVSKYEDPQFVDAIICNPFLDYREHWIDIEVPPNCEYYTGNQALVMTITKR